MRFIAIDFETYYNSKTGCSVKDLGPEGYLNHSDFEAYLVAMTDGVWSWVGHPNNVPWQEYTREPFKFVAHNARFDRPIANEVLRGVDSFNCRGWICTADLAAYFRSGRSLKDASKTLLGVEVSKAKRDEMDGIRYSSLSEDAKKAMQEYCLTDTRLSWQLCSKLYHLWPEIERKVSELNMFAGMLGVGFDDDLALRFLTFCFDQKRDAEAKIPWEFEDGKTPLSITKVREHCAKSGVPAPISMAEDDEACMAWENQYGEQYPFIGALRQWRKANILEKRIAAMRRRLLDVSGTKLLTYSEKYFGSHTGRFAGENQVNMVNQPKDKIEAVGGACVRNLLLPRKSTYTRPNVFAIVDWAQIEPRVLLTLAGDTTTLDLIRGGYSVYEAHARATMGWEGGRLKDENPLMYKLAKARVLGLGYGCAGAKFQYVAKIMAGLDLSLDEAKEAVSDYRAANPGVTALWQKLNYEAKCCCARGIPLEIKLPSWRSLVYENLRHDPVRGLLGDPAQGVTRKIYGGLLTENVVQAIARDIFVQRMCELADAGYGPSFHVHDEYVISIPGYPEDIERAKARIQEICRKPIEWLPSCPLDIDIVIAPCYQK